VPIYAYKCTACGHAQDVLQKMSDKTLTVCPECHQETYAKQVTAAGFQLKGSGWYVTDFRNNSGGGAKKAEAEAAPAVTAADKAGSDSGANASGGEGAAASPAGSTESNASSASSSSTVAAPASPSQPASGGPAPSVPAT